MKPVRIDWLDDDTRKWRFGVVVEVCGSSALQQWLGGSETMKWTETMKWQHVEWVLWSTVHGDGMVDGVVGDGVEQSMW